MGFVLECDNIRINDVYNLINSIYSWAYKYYELHLYILKFSVMVNSLKSAQQVSSLSQGMHLL
jgi:hypothetical protein